MIWVEILSRHGQVTARFSHAGPVLRIGRSYRNDVVLDDAAVAPEHLVIVTSDDGAMIAEAASAATKVTIGGTPHGRAPIDGDTLLQIGHTQLRVRGSDYPVPPATETPMQREPWLLLALASAGALAVYGSTYWLTETIEPRISRYVGGMVGFAVVVLLWAALWALFSRIFSGHARFVRHLAIGFAGLLAYSLYGIVTSLLAFLLSSPIIAGNAFIGLWITLGLLSFVHLQVISPTRAVLKTSILAVLVAAAIIVQWANLFDQQKNGVQPTLARTTFPPAFRFTRPESEDQFFAGITKMKTALDADRATAAAASP
jgi:hypothetical protein